MSQILIKANPDFVKEKPSEAYLQVSEFYYNTIQGEGINLGHPAAFLRMQHCTLNCTWCDTQSVWRYGNPYSITELLSMMHDSGLVTKLQEGQHLILTGGSPLNQQKGLLQFIQTFIKTFGFKPYIEVENECTIYPFYDFAVLVDCWNNSPKLAHSGNSERKRYNPDILSYLSKLDNSWFKFVISSEKDWIEIDIHYLQKGLFGKEQVILMPLGGNREELEKYRERVIEIAIKHGVRYCSREHIVIWDKKTGI